MIAQQVAAQLSTHRLVIRRITPADAASYFAVFSDAEVMRYWSTPPLTALAEAEAKVAAIVEHYRQCDLFQFAVERRLDGQFLGTCTLHHFHEQNRRAEIGYALGRPFWGQGYMHEALVALVDHAFRELLLHRLEADIDPRNEASARSLERLGFQREGLLRERWIVDGVVSDSAVYGLLADEWRRARPDTH